MRLDADQHQIGLQGLDRLGEDGGHGPGPRRQVLVQRDLHDPVGPLGRRRVKGVVDVAEVQGDGRDGSASGLLQQQRLFQGVIVGLVDDERRAAQVERRARGIDFQRLDQVRNLTDHNGDLHTVLLSPKSIDSASNSTMSRTFNRPSKPATLAASSKRGNS